MGLTGSLERDDLLYTTLMNQVGVEVVRTHKPPLQPRADVVCVVLLLQRLSV